MITRPPRAGTFRAKNENGESMPKYNSQKNDGTADVCINIFSLVPIEVLVDRRLTLWQMRVLIALLSFRGKHTDTVWPSRKTLAERCGGMNLCNLSTTTTELCALGWLSKEGDGGLSRSTKYKITIPNNQKVVDSAMVVKSTTQKPEIVAESTNLTVAESTTGKEQTIEQTSKSNRPSSAEIKPHIKPEVIVWNAAKKIFTNISNERIQAWEEAFPKLDIDGELTRSELWYESNPKKRKRDLQRFINGWLSRAFKDLQDRAQPKVFVKQPPASTA